MFIENNNGETKKEVVLAPTAQDAALATPNIANLNVNKSSRIHIGPKIVSVTQNVHNVELIKGKFLGLELVSSKHPHKLRCSVAVCLCWSLIVASAVVVCILILTLSRQTKLDISLQAEWYLRREDWQAMPAYHMRFLQIPQSYVVIGHSGDKHCNQKYQCIERVLEIQQDHLRRDFGDIGPNFLVGGNGFVFEGCGANVHGAMISSWNAKIISIMFIGNYAQDYPDQLQFDHVNVLLETLIQDGVLRSDYILYGQCQLQSQTVPPGRHIMAEMGQFFHWDSVNKTGCL